MAIPAKVATAGELAESVYIEGDLAKLSPEQRTAYYMKVCESLGLNPATRPFQYITLNSKLTLYATRAATDQLRKVNGVSLEIVSRDVQDDILTVHVRATLPDGRRDEDLGSVPFPPTLKGDARANAELKAITKAKRRATLSICGLGWLDETEVETIPGARKPPEPAPNPMLPPHNPDTGEITESAGTTQPPAEAGPAGGDDGSAPAGPADSARIKMWDDKLADAAEKGLEALAEVWFEIPNADRRAHDGLLQQAKDRRHKPRAQAVEDRLARNAEVS